MIPDKAQLLAVSADQRNQMLTEFFGNPRIGMTYKYDIAKIMLLTEKDGTEACLLWAYQNLLAVTPLLYTTSFTEFTVEHAHSLLSNPRLSTKLISEILEFNFGVHSPGLHYLLETLPESVLVPELVNHLVKVGLKYPDTEESDWIFARITQHYNIDPDMPKEWVGRSIVGDDREVHFDAEFPANYVKFCSDKSKRRGYKLS